jgi:hypothetical protein
MATQRVAHSQSGLDMDLLPNNEIPKHGALKRLWDGLECQLTAIFSARWVL